MKKFFYSILLCVIALAITSCSKHDIETNDLIGKWESTEVIDNGEKTKYECFTFEADGSCLYETVVTLNNWEESYGGVFEYCCAIVGIGCYFALRVEPFEL